MHPYLCNCFQASYGVNTGNEIRSDLLVNVSKAISLGEFENASFCKQSNRINLETEWNP